MTEELAKQKVREIHPAAFRSAKGTVWSEHGMTKVRLGKNWQNAAESLPAQKYGAPVPIAGYKCRHDYALPDLCPSCDPADFYSVAPVGAKEKPTCPVCHKPSGDYENPEGCWHNVTAEGKIEYVAEPKPTPSTPTEHKPILLETASAGCTCGWPNDGLPRRWHQVDEHIKKATCTHEWMPPPPRKPYCTLCGTLKPQPDSSSIPDLKPWLDQAVDLLNLYSSGYCPKDVAKDFLEKCRLNFGNVADYKPFVDSSSISTDPWCDLPNGSGYWWHHDGNPDLRPFIYHVQVSLTGSPRYFIDFPDSRWCDQVGGKWMKVFEPTAWDAAKGQSNGR